MRATRGGREWDVAKKTRKTSKWLVLSAAILVLCFYGQRVDAGPYDIKVFSGGIADIDVSDAGVIANLESGNVVGIGEPLHDFGSQEAWGGPFHNDTVTLADTSGKTAVIQLCLTNCPPCVDLSNMFSMAFAGGGQSFPNRWDMNEAYFFGFPLNSLPKPTEIPSLEGLADELVVLDALFVRKLVGVQNHSTREEAKLYYQFGAEGFVGELLNNKTFIPDYLFPPTPNAPFAQERIHFDISFRESVEQFAELRGVSLTDIVLPEGGALRGSKDISVLYDGSTEPQTGANYDMAIAYGGKPFPNRPVVPRVIYADRDGNVRANVIGTTLGSVKGARVTMAQILALRDVSGTTAQDLIDHATDVINEQPSTVIPESVSSDLLDHLAGASRKLSRRNPNPNAVCKDLNAAGLVAENAYNYEVHPLANDSTRPVITRDEVTFEIILDIADAIRKLPVPFNCHP
jgi:hypothetical protein